MLTSQRQAIYLDYNALAPVKPQVCHVMARWHSHDFAYNSASVHMHGRRAASAAQDATANLIATYGPDHRLIWTSGCTEANSMVLATFKHRPILCPVGDHPSLMAPHAHLLPLNQRGQVDSDTLEKILKEIQPPFLLAFSVAHGETGIIQEAEALAHQVHKAGGYVHIDAAQAIGRMPLKCDKFGADYLSFTSSKCGGPCGIGGLFWKKPAPLEPLLRGSNPDILRPGTLPLALVMGCWEALCPTPLGDAAIPETSVISFNSSACSDIASLPKSLVEQTHAGDLQNYLEKTLQDFCPQAFIVGREVPRLGNTTVICMPGVKADTQWINFDLEGMSVSRGAACRSGQTRSAPVLGFMGLSDALASTALRISTGWGTTHDHIKRFIDVWKILYLRAAV